VLTSDKVPRDIPGLGESAGANRFESGLIADIAPPDWKPGRDNSKEGSVGAAAVAAEVAFLCRAECVSERRELEGCLMRLSALASMSDSAITTDFAITRCAIDSYT